MYFPYKKSIDLESNESAMFIKDDRIYISAWVEEGWDNVNNIAGPDYEYYNKIIIKDWEGETILEKRGDLFLHIDGSWRLA